MMSAKSSESSRGRKEWLGLLKRIIMLFIKSSQQNNLLNENGHGCHFKEFLSCHTKIRLPHTKSVVFECFEIINFVFAK